MRRPVEADRRVWITEPEAVRLLDLANAIYGQVLTLLAQSYGPSGVDSRRAYADAAVSLMQAVSVLGQALARVPASPDWPGVMAGMTFSVPRNLGLRAPASAAAILTERLEELGAAYEAIRGADPKSPIAQAQRRLRHLQAEA